MGLRSRMLLVSLALGLSTVLMAFQQRRLFALAI